MAVAWVEEVRQTALIDEASQLATRYLSPEFADVRAIYAVIGFDALAFATQLKADSSAARAERGGSAVSQVNYEVESAQSREAVKACGSWFEQLRRAARFALVEKRPFGERAERLLAGHELSDESWSKARDGMDVALTWLRTTDLAGTGLPADFVARGDALVTRLDAERSDADGPWLGRSRHSGRLQELLATLAASLERVVAARDLAMAVTGKDIPGLELGLVRAAAAPSKKPGPLGGPDGGSAGESGL
jgi:hypothetical protein